MNKKRGLALAVVIFFLLALLIGMYNLEAHLADENREEGAQPQVVQPSQAPQNDSFSDPSYLLIKAVVLIVIFSVVLYFLLRSSKNFIFTKTLAGSSSRIQIKGSKIIGPRKWLYIVDVLGHILLLGVTEKQVTVLLDMPFENLSEEEKRLWNDEVKTSEPNFKKLLHHWLRK